MEEQRRLLPNSAQNVDENSSDEWSDDSSSGSYYSDSDSSSVPEWESSVDDITGELIFINCHPFVTQNTVEKPRDDRPPFSTKNQLRQSTRGKFLRLIRRRESKRHSRRLPKAQDFETAPPSNKVKFQDSQEGEEREVTLKINTDLQRKPTSGAVGAAEIVLGVNIGTLSDGNRVMIAGFLPQSEAKHEKNIKIGDWLKSVNNVEVTYHNINSVIDRMGDKKEALLKLQRVAGVDVTKDPPINELNCQSKFVQQLIGQDSQDELIDNLCQYAAGVLYLNMDNLSETNDSDDVIYCYPRPLQKTLLCSVRGMFITLDHLISEITKTKPRTSLCFHNNELISVAYKSLNNNLLLLMLPHRCAPLAEISLICDQVVRMLEFLYRDLDCCFNQQRHNQVDKIFGGFFTRMLNGGQWITTDAFLKGHANKLPNQVNFEEVLPAAPFLHLPSEAHMQIEDALTELEASDYREWNEEPLDCQRLFTILGSVLYHDGYLLASHLEYEDLIDVHIYCRLQGFLHLSRTEPLKTLVFWKEVFPYSCNRFQDSRKIPEGRRYLLLVGSAKDLLAVIMEAGGCTEPPDDNMGPDAFYVEEAQATLAHLQELGLPELADRWLAMNPGPQVTIPDAVGRKKTDFLDTINRSGRDQKKTEVTSILKRPSDPTSFTAGSVPSVAEDHCNSEDSSSQGGHSEMSDEAGGRRPRDKITGADEDESDAEDYGDGSQMSNSSFDISELRQTLLSETEDMYPPRLTAGLDNVLFHFVQLDTTEGILLCPPQCRVHCATLDIILNKFRACAHKIHSLFRNTMRFKNMPAQDMAKSVMNKSLIAIKEHGVMFESPFVDDADSKRTKIRYWVIGRLFYIPHPREVYVCYQDTVPQNMIELAFKINLSISN